MSPAVSLRWPLLASGALLLVQAARLRSSRSRRPLPSAGTRPVSGAIGRLVASLARVSIVIRGHPDAWTSASIASHLAAAPGCWPAHWVSAAALADRAGSRSLADLLRGVQATVGVSLFVAVTAALVPVLGPASPLAGACAAVAGSAACRLALARAARRADHAAGDGIAGSLDLLAAATAAGLPGPMALHHAAANAPPALAAALRRVSARRDTGLSSAAAWLAEAHALRLPALADVAEAAERHETTGAPLAAELRRIATRSRSDARAALTEKAARRGPIGTVVVAVVIAPLSVATLVACLVGGLVEGGTLGLR